MANGKFRSNCRCRRRASRISRAGVSTVELAVCLPVLLLLVIGSIECSGIIFVKQAISTAAYEGIRVAVDPDGTSAAARQRCNEMLASRSINDATITITPANVKRVEPGQPIEVKISVPSGTNRFFPARFVKDVEISAAVVMVKE